MKAMLTTPAAGSPAPRRAAPAPPPGLASAIGNRAMRAAVTGTTAPIRSPLPPGLHPQLEPSTRHALGGPRSHPARAHADQLGTEGHGQLEEVPQPSTAPSAEPTATPGDNDWQFVTGKKKNYAQRPTRLTYQRLSLAADGSVTDQGPDALENNTLHRQYGNVRLVKVKLPDKVDRDQLVEIFRQGVSWNGTHYRLDQFDTGDAKHAWGVEDADAGRIEQVRADEWNEYARQGNFARPVAGIEMTFAVTLAPIGTAFRLRGGPALQIDDGFGFIRASVAEQMGVPAPAQAEREGLAKPAQPNTQMLQWMREDNAVVAELVDRALHNLEQALDPRARGVNDETIFRAATTGNFPVRYSTAVPVPGKNVVLSIDIGPGSKRVALHRSPADKPNWAQGELEPAGSELSKQLATMTAFQYRLKQKEDPSKQQPLLMMKGLLGVIPDAKWPEAFGPNQIVGCVTDCKVDSSWDDEAQVSAAKKATEPRALSLKGNLAVTKVMHPGSLVGVPSEMMTKLSGDYDGDAVHILREDDCPMLFSRLADLDQRSNPKLTKNIVLHGRAQPEAAEPEPEGAFANPYAPLAEDWTPPALPEHAAPGPRSMADRLIEIRDTDFIVGIWSTIADLLCTVHPQALAGLLPDMSRILDIKLDDVAALWEVVGLGIKVGTDLPKTNLSKLEFRGTPLTSAGLLASGRKLSRFLRRERRLDNPHARRNKAAIVKDLKAGDPMAVRDRRRLGHYGMPGRIMRAVNEYLRLKKDGIATSAATASYMLDAPLMQRATKIFAEARDEEIEDVDVLNARIHELIGELLTLFMRNKRDPQRSGNADRWLLRALAEVEPSTLAQQLKKDGGDTAPEDVFASVIKQIERVFQSFLQGAAALPDATTTFERPPVRWAW